MPTVTFHDKPLATSVTGAEEIPFWDVVAAAAKRVLVSTVKRLIVNPTGVEAGGTDQSGATVIGAQEFHTVTVVASGSGTKFAALASGLEGTRKLIRVPAAATNVLLHYPPNGGKINDLAVDAPIPIEPGTTAEFYSVSTVNWITVP